MNKFKKSKFFIFFLITISLIGVLVFSPVSSYFISFSSNIISTIDRMIARPVTFVLNEKDRLFDLMKTYKENGDLKKALYTIEEKANKVDSLEDENSQLRQLLDLKEQDQNTIKIASEVIARSPSAWTNELTIDKGAASDVTKSMLAISNGGVIGAVTQVSADSSVVTLLSNEKNSSQISVKIQTETGFVYGIITGFDSKNSTFIVSQLNSFSGVTEGASVLTSGLGTYNAENLLVGKVLSVSKGKDQLNDVILVQPAADFSDIQAVILVRN